MVFIFYFFFRLYWAYVPDAVLLALLFWRTRILKGFKHIWVWRPSWSCDPDTSNKLTVPLHMDAPYEIGLFSDELFEECGLRTMTD